MNEDKVQLLKDYVATYQNPEYGGDWELVNFKFPELEGVDQQILKDYVATYQNPEYGGDWELVNSKFPELFDQGIPSVDQIQPATEEQIASLEPTLTDEERSAMRGQMAPATPQSDEDLETKRTNIQLEEIERGTPVEISGIQIDILGADKAARSAAEQGSMDEGILVNTQKQVEWGPTGFTTMTGQPSSGSNQRTPEQLERDRLERIDEAYRSSYMQEFKNQINSQLEGTGATEEDKKKIETYLWDTFDIGMDLTGDQEYNDVGWQNSIGSGFELGGVNAKMTAAYFLNDWTEDLDDDTRSTVMEFIPPSLQTSLFSGWDKDFLSDMRANKMEELRKSMIQREYTATEALIDGRIGDVFQIAAETTAESAPITALAIAGGLLPGGQYAAGLAIGSLASAQHYMDVKDQDWFKDMDPLERYGYMFAYGASEGVSELVGGRIVARSFKGLAHAVTRPKSIESLVQIMKGLAVRTGKDFSEEAVAEMLAQGSQGYLERLAKGEDMKGLLEEIIDAGVTGGFSGVIMGGLGNVSKTLLDSGRAIMGDRTAVANKLANSSQLTSRLASIQSDYMKAVERGADPTELAGYVDAIRRITREIDEKVNNNQDVLGSMSEDQFEEFKSLMNEIQTLDIAIENTESESVRNSLSATRADLSTRISGLISTAKNTPKGNTLFSEPVEEVASIADAYTETNIGKKRETFDPIRSLDKDLSTRIAQAYDAMEDNPSDPEVAAAYEAMVKETMDQLQAFNDAGYTIEITESEPYTSSAEMIEDLKKNKRIKILATEAEFGNTGITDEMRENNPLLKDSGTTDSNGKPLLVNDVFRGIHDFFGHAELGNSFGPIGEENAWNVHARMYSPLARRAMTTETRGQNSWVNFSGVNEEAFKLRDEARRLRKEGKVKEANELTNKVYEMMKFADQKIGLLPEEFSQLPSEQSSEVSAQENIDSDQEMKNSLPDSGMSREELLEKIRTGVWGMLTGENADAKQMTPEENAEANRRAEQWLRDRGYSPIEIFGKYGNPENSFFVEGLSKEDAIEFAKEFQQESVATNEGIIYQDGSMNPRVGESFDVATEDNYSAIKTSDGLVEFAVDYSSETIQPEVEEGDQEVVTREVQEEAADLNEVLSGKEETTTKTSKRKPAEKKEEKEVDPQESYIQGYKNFLIATAFKASDSKKLTPNVHAVSTRGGVVFLMKGDGGWFIADITSLDRNGKPVYEASETFAGDSIEDAIDFAKVNGSSRMRIADDTDSISESDLNEIGSNPQTTENEMNKLDDGMAKFKQPTTEPSQVNPIQESKSTKKITNKEAKSLGFNSVEDMSRPVEDFDGIPMMAGMSDSLASGEIKDASGKRMKVDGGILFNVFNRLNRGLAWAGVDRAGAETQLRNAKKLYESHKNLFHQLWRSGRLPSGHVPMAVFRMADTAIKSNEAVWRWLNPYMKTASKTKRMAAMRGFRSQFAAKKMPTKVKNSIESFLRDGKFETIDQFIDAVIKDAGIRTESASESKLGLDDRAVIFDLIISAKGKQGGSLVAKALGQGRNGLDRSLFTMASIMNGISEPSMMGLSQGDIVAIEGIEVAKEVDGDFVDSGEVLRADHGNYGYGPKGRLISLISNPVNGVNIFPEWAAKAPRLFRRKAEGVYTKISLVIQQVGGSFFNNKAFVGSKISSSGITDLDLIIGKLRLAFPNIQVSMNMLDFQEAMMNPNVRTRVKDGMVLYGITSGGKIVLNPEIATVGTAIHEFGHIWTDYLRSTTKGMELLKRGMDLVKGTDQYKEELAKYPNDPELAAEEALVELIAAKGTTIIDAAKRSKFQNWLKAVFEYIKNTLGGTTDSLFNSSDKSGVSNKIKNLTLEEFINYGLSDMFSGENLGLTDQQISEAARFSMREDFSTNYGVDLNSADMGTIINFARKEGYSDAAIREVLKLRKYSVKDINKALEIKIDKGDVLPMAFTKVEGGAKAGVSLFNEVKTEVAKWYKNKKSRDKKPPSQSQLRAKYLDVLASKEAYQNLDSETQMEVAIAMDNFYGIRSGRDVSRQISSMKESLRRGKIKNLKEAQRQMRAFIREVLPNYSVSRNEVNRLISKVSSATTTDMLAARQIEVMEVIDKVRDREKSRLLKDIRTISRKKGRIRKTSSGKRRANSVDADGQLFFNEIYKAIKMAESMTHSEFMAEVMKMAEDPKLYQVVSDYLAGRKINGRKNAEMLYRYLAMNNFGQAVFGSLENVQQIHEDLLSKRAESLAIFSGSIANRAAIRESIEERAKKEIREGWGSVMYDESGNLKGPNALKNDKLAMRRRLASSGFFKEIIPYLTNKEVYTINGLRKWFRETLYHLGTFATVLDKKGSIFKEFIYDRLNRMESNYKGGYFSQLDRLKVMAKQVGFKDYVQFRRQLAGHPGMELKLKGLKSRKFTAGELLRFYSLYQNEVQRTKLENQGITKEMMNSIESHLGPKLLSMADTVIQYLNSTYYESVNTVFKDVNGINLGYVENYFPTQTVTDGVQKELMESGDFSKIFDAETAPSLKDRVDTESEVLIDPRYNFVDVLNNHIDLMERYKAFAKGTRELNYFMQTEDVVSLLNVTGMNKIVRNAINYAINPNSVDPRDSSSWITSVFSSFTSFVLAFKFIQIPKQATSFINAKKDYEFSPKRNIPGLNSVMFMVDMAEVVLKMRSNIQKAYSMSPEFRMRFEQAFNGDVYTLETGTNVFKRISKGDSRWGRALRAMKTASASPTTLGDIMGVMGYMANYNRDIKNGMDPEKAMARFEDYNATQQSRRGSEKISLQRSRNEYVRVFTLFGSTTFLYINEVNQALIKMKNGDYSRKTINQLVLSLGVANVLFVAMSNIFKLTMGNDEDEEDVMRQMGDAMMGANLVYQIPFLGAGIEDVVRSSRGQRTYDDGGMINPVTRLINKQKSYLDDGEYLKMSKDVAYMVMGTNLDPLIALANRFAGDTSDENMFEILGVSKSYRPTGKDKEDERRILNPSFD